MTNLDFSGLFGGGAFAIDPTKFNFSAYTPEPKKEVVTDPVDVVSNNTPNAQVEILEGAGTVAVTKPDPVQQAIDDLQGKDLTKSFNVNPLASVEEQVEIAPLTSNIPVSSGEATNASFLDVSAGQTGVSSNIDYDVGAEQAFDLLDGSLDSNGKIKEINEYLKGEQFGGYMSEYDSRLTSLGDYDRIGGATTNLLNQVGLSKALGVQGEYGGYKQYTYNPETNQYELTRDTEKSMLEAAAPDLAVAAFTAAATAGLGSALSSSFAISSTTGQAIAAGATSALQGGDLEDVVVSALSAGFAEEVKTLQEAAQTVGATKEAIALADTMKSVETAIDLVKAVDNKNILGAISSGMELAGMDSLLDFTEDTIAESLGETAGMGVDGALTEWACYNSDHIAEATLKFADTLIKGGNLGEATQDAVIKYIRDEGGFSDLFPKGEGFNIDFETPEVIEQVAQWIADGASTVNRAIIKPTVGAIETLAYGAVGAADELVRAIPITKEEAEQFIDNTAEFVRNTGRDIREAVSPVTETVRGTGRQIEETYDTAEDYVKEEVAPTIRDTGRDIREAVSPVTETVRDTGRAIEGVASQFELGAEGSADVSNLDYFYDDSDIIRNPLLSSGKVRIQDLASALQFEEEKAKKEARRGALKDEEDRIKRSKGVLNLGLQGNLRYTG